MIELGIRKLKEEDYDDILVKWWRDWRWTPPAKEFLPEDGAGGVIVYDGETPVCAGFIYVSNSQVAWIEFVISNMDVKNREVREASIDLLISSLTNIAKESGYKYIFTRVKNQSLINVYSHLGYVIGDVGATEMIKKL
jgi:hypothetical protein